jgi:hypothetical protein
MRIRTILAAAAAPAALAAILLGTAGQASAATTAVQGQVQLSQHADTDFSGQTWALDNVSQHQVVTNVTGGSGNYSYDVTYDEQGTFTTQVGTYYGATTPVTIQPNAHGVMNGTGSVHVTGASQVPDMKYLKGLGDNVSSISQTLAPGIGFAGISNWHYDYNYKIPGTSFSAEQSDTVNTP